jgi:hypothetical protein
MVCVITAGAIALGLWEPLAYMMLNAQGFNGYAFGVTLLGLFLVLLLLFRIAMDRLVPANLQPPKAASMVLGTAFGLVSGVLTMGLVIIGAGYIQSSVQIGDVAGYVRRSDEPKAPTIGSDNAYVLSLVNLTVNFYAHLSAGSFTPWLGGGPINIHQPELAKNSLSLYRDSYLEGQGRVGISPSSISGLQFIDAGDTALDPGVGAQAVPAYAVMFTVAQDAFDGNGQQFILSASQARLIGAGRNGVAKAVHPSAWKQNSGAGLTTFYFNSPANYATSQPPGSGEATFVLLFPKAAFDQQDPRYLQLKGVRFKLPAVTTNAEGLAESSSTATAKIIEDPDANTLSSALVVSPDPTYSLPVTLNSNSKGNLSLDKDNYIINGSERFDRQSNSSVGSELRIRGFKPPEGTRIIRIDCSATEGGARLFPDVNQWVREAGAEAQDARVAVVDSDGNKFFATGFAEDDTQYLTVTSSGGRPLRLRDIPIQTLGAPKKLLLYFSAPNGAKLEYLALDTPTGLRVLNKLNFQVKIADQ